MKKYSIGKHALCKAVSHLTRLALLRYFTAFRVLVTALSTKSDDISTLYSILETSSPLREIVERFKRVKGVFAGEDEFSGKDKS